MMDLIVILCGALLLASSAEGALSDRTSHAFSKTTLQQRDAMEIKTLSKATKVVEPVFIPTRPRTPPFANTATKPFGSRHASANDSLASQGSDILQGIHTMVVCFLVVMRCCGSISMKLLEAMQWLSTRLRQVRRETSNGVELTALDPDITALIREGDVEAFKRAVASRKLLTLHVQGGQLHGKEDAILYLIEAVQFLQPEIVAFLLDAGIPPNKKHTRQHLSAIDVYDMVRDSSSCFSQPQLKKVRALLYAKLAECLATEEKFSERERDHQILSAIYREDELAIALYLNAHKARERISYRFQDGSNLIAQSLAAGKLGIAKWLLSVGVDPNGSCKRLPKEGWSALKLALSTGDASLVHEIVAKLDAPVGDDIRAYCQSLPNHARLLPLLA